MQFETTTFAIFLTVALAAYWLVRTNDRQNVLVVVANYVFCGWFDIRFAAVLWLASAISFVGAFWIAKGESSGSRKARLVTCLTALAGTLVLLKYGKLLATALGQLAPSLDASIARGAASIFVPIGISYYVLQTAGYCIDVYRGRAPERDVTTYFAWVGFFPYLVAGPIVQAGTVLTQFSAARSIDADRVAESVKQIVWGLYKKLVVADSLARTVDYIFARHTDLPASTLALGLAMYSFQVYADFSGYSDIALGLGRLFGFDLPRNFDAPYFARNVAEFWRRWHMSLSAWLRNYVYVPIGGHGTSRLVHARNILIVFALSGLWHGVTWNFLAWGVLNGLYFLPMIFFGSRGKGSRAATAEAGAWGARDLAGVALTFSLISLSRVFFRSPDMPSALAFFRGLFDSSLFTLPDLNVSALGWVALMLAVEWAQRFGRASELPRRVLSLLRYPAYATVVYFVFIALARHDAREFLYARF